MSAETITPVKKPKKPRDPNARFSISLKDGQGGEMWIAAERRADGTFTTYAVHKVRNASGKTDKSKSQGRGATQVSMDAAKAEVEKLAAQAIKAGWTRKSGGGFKRRPDAFDAAHLPAAAKPAKK